MKQRTRLSITFTNQHGLAQVFPYSTAGDMDGDAYDPRTYHPDDIANGNAAEAQAEDARRKAEDDEEEAQLTHR